MKNTARKSNRSNRHLPAIVAVGSSLAALPAGALELGELTVQSRLGQPLRASIAYALAPSEQLANYCVTLRPGASVSGLPGIGTPTVSVVSGVILLSGTTPVREPMVSAHLVVNCPYAANLSREYMLFIDPLISAYQQPAVTQQISPPAAPLTVAPAVTQSPAAPLKPTPVMKDIAAAATYRVVPGDTLSGIAKRIQNRSVALWPAVHAIFEANPAAFMNNDPNQLKAGSWLSIPSFDGSAAVVAAATIVAVPTTLIEATTNVEATTSVEATASVEATTSVADPAAAPSSGIVLDNLADGGVTTGDLQPGDIILDAQLEGPKTSSSSPNVPTAIITTRSMSNAGTASPSWMIWLAGSGIALVFGLIMFGRRLRNDSRTAPTASQADQPNGRRFSDTQSETENVEAIGVDFDLTDDSPTQENLVLDADLVIGTGLGQSADSDISQDFGFAATTDLDIELPFEPIAEPQDETDMLPPLRPDGHSILDSEIMPEEDDDDYDMSVIVDATKMPQPEDVTERDLKAVEVATGDVTMIDKSYTISKEVDYQIVEQDYEDEMTATQALNEEIARAAAELNARMDVDSGDETAALPLASVTELDITAQMPAQNDELSDLDDTGINEALSLNTAADDDTVEMPAESGKAS